LEVPESCGDGAVMYAENSMAVAPLASAVLIAWTSGGVAVELFAW